MKRFFQKYLKVGLPIILIIFMMVWLSGSFNRGMITPGNVTASETSATDVKFYTVSAVTVPLVMEAVGTVQPQFKTTVSARVTANVVELPVSAGQYVHKGDLLVRLDDQDLRARRQQAQESLRRAEAIRSLAKINHVRYKALIEKDFIAKSDFDEKTQLLETSTAEVAALQQAKHDAEFAVGYAVISSPYDGIVVDKLSDIGDVATPGKPLLTIYESGKLWLEATVPEEQANALNVGKSYEIHIDSLNQQMQGVLMEIVPTADSSSRTITARVALPITPKVFPGLFGRMLIPGGKYARIMIPQAAVLSVGQLTMVDVEVAGIKRRRSVQVGRLIDERVEILSGLDIGEKVSLAPQKGVQP